MEKESTPMSLRERLSQSNHALTADELGDLFSLSASQVYKLARSGELPSFRIGGSVRFDPAAIAELIEREKSM